MKTTTVNAYNSLYLGSSDDMIWQYTFIDHGDNIGFRLVSNLFCSISKSINKGIFSELLMLEELQ